eukprot:TRINITY_DN9659_c0_g1_i2.p1 TRINITY_DN9659_c0_g1~~TRINITY_DN9659_c0_g1_i2.p1  ORF type:complete len:665 (-),score=151.55 TRINITY_DN9659_c0_g1_i2:49-2043(-)
MQLCDFKVIPLLPKAPSNGFLHVHKDKTTHEKYIGRKVIQPDFHHFKLQSKAKMKHSFLKDSWVVIPCNGQLVLFDCKKGSTENYSLYEKQSFEHCAHSFPWVILFYRNQVTVVRILREADMIVVRRYYWNKAPITGITMNKTTFTIISEEGLHFYRLDVNEIMEYFKIVEIGYVEVNTSSKMKNVFKQFEELFLHASRNVVSLFDLKNQSLLCSIQSADNCYFLYGHLQNNIALCATSNSLYIIFLEAKRKKSVFIIPLSSPISIFKVSQDYLLTGSFDGAVRVYDLRREGTHLYDLNVKVDCSVLTTSNMVNTLTVIGDEYVIVSTVSGVCEVYSMHIKYQKSPVASFDLNGDVIVEISQGGELINFLTYNKDNDAYGHFVWKPSMEKLQQYTNETIISEFISRPKPEKKGVFSEWKSHNHSGMDQFIPMIQQLAEKEYPFLTNWNHACTITNNNLPDNPIVFVTESFCEMTGYDRDEIYGHNCRFLQGKHTDSETVKKVSQHLKEGKTISVQLLNYRKDGYPFWNVFLVLPVHDAKGKVPAFIAIQQDITEIRISQPLSKWLSVHTSLWLEHIGKNMYAHLFIHNKIDGRKLVSLSIEQLVALGTSREDAHFLFEQIQILVERDLKTKPFKHLSASVASMKTRKGGFSAARVPSSRSADEY